MGIIYLLDYMWIRFLWFVSIFRSNIQWETREMHKRNKNIYFSHLEHCLCLQQPSAVVFVIYWPPGLNCMKGSLYSEWNVSGPGIEVLTHCCSPFYPHLASTWRAPINFKDRSMCRKTLMKWNKEISLYVWSL